MRRQRRSHTRRLSRGTTTTSTPTRCTGRTRTNDGVAHTTRSRPSPTPTSNTLEVSRLMMTNGQLTTTNGTPKMLLQVQKLLRLRRRRAVVRRRRSLTSISPRESPIWSTRSPSTSTVITLMPSRRSRPSLSKPATATLVNSSKATGEAMVPSSSCSNPMEAMVAMVVVPT